MSKNQKILLVSVSAIVLVALVVGGLCLRPWWAERQDKARRKALDVEGWSQQEWDGLKKEIAASGLTDAAFKKQCVEAARVEEAEKEAALDLLMKGPTIKGFTLGMTKADVQKLLDTKYAELVKDYPEQMPIITAFEKTREEIKETFEKAVRERVKDGMDKREREEAEKEPQAAFDKAWADATAAYEKAKGKGSGPAFTLVYDKEDKLVGVQVNSEAVDTVFGSSALSNEQFVQAFVNAYGIPLDAQSEESALLAGMGVTGEKYTSSMKNPWLVEIRVGSVAFGGKLRTVALVKMSALQPKSQPKFD